MENNVYEASTEVNPLGQDNFIENSENVVDFSNLNGEQFIDGNQVISNTNIGNFNALGENNIGTIAETSGNDEHLDFFKTTSEEYTTEELPKINSPKIFTSKILEDSKKILSSYSTGQTEESNTLIKSENVDISANPSTKISKDPKIDKSIDLSDPKIAELVKKYRTEVVVEPREEVKYIPVKKLKYVKILKVYVPTIKKVYVPGKKVVIPKKKIVYVKKPKNVNASQMTSQISTSTNPIISKSTYVNPLSTSTNNFNKMTQSINNLNNSQMLRSVNPSMSLIPTDKSLAVSTHIIEIPLSSSRSTSNMLQSSINLTGKSTIFNYSYLPRVYRRTLSNQKLNNNDNYTSYGQI